MHSALTILWMVPSVFFGIGTIITLVALRRAPEGREDEHGFHFASSRPSAVGTDGVHATQAMPTSGVGMA